MNREGVNPQIIKYIEQHVGNDKILEEFLKDLVYEEGQHGGAYWHWRRVYKNKIEQMSKQWEPRDED